MHDGGKMQYVKSVYGPGREKGSDSVGREKSPNRVECRGQLGNRMNDLWALGQLSAEESMI